MSPEFDIVHYAQIAWKRRRVVAFVVGVATSTAVLGSLLMTNIYRAQASLMPVGGQKSGMMVTNALPVLGGLLGGVGVGPSSSVALLAILKSRSLAERVIEKNNLMPLLFPHLWDQKAGKWKSDDPKKIPPMEAAVGQLLRKVSFTDDKKNQLIIIAAEFRNRQVAADLANGYIKELGTFINESALTSAKRNRIFIEGQLERNNVDLLASGKELTNFYSTNKVSNIVPNVDVDISIKSADENETAKTDALVFAESQKKTAELQQRADAIEAHLQKARIVKDVPQQVYLQYLTLKRQLLGQINALLTQQFEMAKIDEAREDLNFEVIDWARVPVKKIRPARRQIVLFAFFISLLLGLGYAFAEEYGIGKLLRGEN